MISYVDKIVSMRRNLVLVKGEMPTELANTFQAIEVHRRCGFFSAEALLLKIYGEPIRAFVEKRLALMASAAAVAVVGLVMAIKFAL